jgi:hypothetical protein
MHRIFSGGCPVIDQCANPRCNKPLHYLREGRIFVFDLPDPNLPTPGGRARRLQHYWLCGACAEIMVLEQTSEMEIRVALKTGKTDATKLEVFPGLAS